MQHCQAALNWGSLFEVAVACSSVNNASGVLHFTVHLTSTWLGEVAVSVILSASVPQPRAGHSFFPSDLRWCWLNIWAAAPAGLCKGLCTQKCSPESHLYRGSTSAGRPQCLSSCRGLAFLLRRLLLLLHPSPKW